jgi:hypothetical protein
MMPSTCRIYPLANSQGISHSQAWPADTQIVMDTGKAFTTQFIHFRPPRHSFYERDTSSYHIWSPISNHHAQNVIPGLFMGEGPPRADVPVLRALVCW